MSAETKTLDEMLANLIKQAEKFKAEHGSCRVTVGPASPFAQAKIERAGGFWIDVEHGLTLMSRDGSSTKVDGDLIYYRAAEHDDLTPKDIAQSIDWMSSWGDGVEFSSASWSSVDETGAIYLEGRRGDDLVDATFVLREFHVRPDDDADWDDDEDDDTQGWHQ